MSGCNGVEVGAGSNEGSMRWGCGGRLRIWAKLTIGRAVLYGPVMCLTRDVLTIGGPLEDSVAALAGLQYLAREE